MNVLPILVPGALGAGAIFLRALKRHLAPAKTPRIQLPPIPTPPPAAAPPAPEPVSQPAPEPGPNLELPEMSILTDLMHGKITFRTAATEIEQWGSALMSKAPAAVQADVGTVVSDLKQAASNAVQFADAAAGPLIAEGASVAGAAFTAFLTKYLGPLATVESGVTQDAINSGAAAFKAEIDALATQALAALKPASSAQPAP